MAPSRSAGLVGSARGQAIFGAGNGSQVAALGVLPWQQGHLHGTSGIPDPDPLGEGHGPYDFGKLHMLGKIHFL